MALGTLNISKNWFKGTTVNEVNWDAIRNPLIAWATNINLAIDQIRKDSFGSSYSIDNDGAPNLSLDLQTQINNIILGSASLSSLTLFDNVTSGASLTQFTARWRSPSPATNDALIFSQQMNSSTTNGAIETQIRSVVEDVTHATRTSALAFHTMLNGTLAERVRVKGNGDIAWKANTAFTATLTHSLGANRTITLLDPGANDSFTTGLSPYLVPIGSIIPFYDFNGGLTFNPTYWKYCNGASVTVGSIGAQTLPDLSNRYLVGFGTEGGADIGSAAWATAAVGNASHQINLQHSHTVNSHTHDLASHTHTGPSHTHGPGTLVFETFSIVPSAGLPHFYGFSGGSTFEVAKARSASFGADFYAYEATSNFGGGSTYETGNGGGVTASSGTGATSTPSTNTSGSASPGTDSQLSTTQSIQPRSIRVRFIMRVL